MVAEGNRVFVWDDIEGVLAQKAGATGRYWFEWVLDRKVPMDMYGSVPYIESQILGGVFLKDDVDDLYYPETDELNRPFFRKLRRLAEEFRFGREPY